jgi:hypothetical protein
MKPGNFVGGGWLPMEKKELDKMLVHFQKQLTDIFGKDFFKSFTYKYEPEPIGGVIHAIFSAKLAKPFNGRNQFNSTIKNCTEVRFFVTKDKGRYLEIRDKRYPYNPDKWKHDTKNCPSFCYGCTMSVTGSERPYRCRHWESIQNWSPYTYGTEVKDLTYRHEDFVGLRKAITPKY